MAKAAPAVKMVGMENAAALERCTAAFANFRLRTVARTSSTQDVVRTAARRAVAEGFCCIAGEQTEGRGRQGRTWVAPAGTALLASLLLRPPAERAPGVPLAAGLAVRAALRAYGIEARVKWPNDVLIDGMKVAGVLAEAEGAGTVVILGFGINMHVDRFPEGVCGASMHRYTDAMPDRFTLLATVLESLRSRLEVVYASGVPGLLAEWRAHAYGIGASVRVTTGTDAVSGVAVDIDDDGALLIDTDQGRVRVLAGDVHLLR